jgi:uncharacterized cupin superfamily protein
MLQIIVWECTEGHFKWHYEKDESVIVIWGEAFLIKENGEELRFGPGDLGCPRGEFSYWREIWLRRIKAAAEEKEREIA